MNKLLLFDIDGTLLAKATGHVEAFAVAFQEVYGVYASIYMIKYQGKTDQQIIREVLLACGVSEGDIQSKMSNCMAVMCNYFKTIESYVKADVLSGVTDTLTLLDTETNLLGLVTGNLEPIAHAKLGSADIDKHFKLGGFGSDAAERSELVAKAIQKAREQFGFTVDDNIYLFGDAPQDMQAAVAGGAKAIGVTTGIYSKDELLAAGANQVISGLSDQTAVTQALQN